MFAARLQFLRGTLAVSEPVYLAIVFLLLLGPILLFFYEFLNASLGEKRPKNLRRIGLVGKSNLEDQYDPRWNLSNIGSTAKVKALFIHPVKSCAPIELHRSRIVKSGLVYDRCFAFAEEVTDKKDASVPRRWVMKSQRDYPLMAKLDVELWVPDANSLPQDPLVQAGGCIDVLFPKERFTWKEHMAARLDAWDWSALPRIRFRVPLLPTKKQIDQFQLEIMGFAIHNSPVVGIDMGKFASFRKALPALKRFLGIPPENSFTLLRCSPDQLRKTEDDLAPSQVLGYEAMHGFTDDQPVNINNIASVRDLSEKVPKAFRMLDAKRFRANVWVAGPAPYEEETWKRVRFHPAPESGPFRKQAPFTLSVVCRTTRCLLPNVDPSTGIQDKREPFRTLNMHRRVDAGAPGKACLGMQCVPEQDCFASGARDADYVCIAVGDTLDILQTGVHRRA